MRIIRSCSAARTARRWLATRRRSAVKKGRSVRCMDARARRRPQVQANWLRKLSRSDAGAVRYCCERPSSIATSAARSCSHCRILNLCSARIGCQIRAVNNWRIGQLCLNFVSSRKLNGWALDLLDCLSWRGILHLEQGCSAAIQNTLQGGRSHCSQPNC
jgi:hypothetical protein